MLRYEFIIVNKPEYNWKGGGGGRMVRPPRAVVSKGRQTNILNKNIDFRPQLILKYRDKHREIQ
jgi:hypothetical protein